MSGEGGHRGSWDAGDEPVGRSGDLGMRQLQRRYDALREDYRELLGRLNELEQGSSPARGAAGTGPSQKETVASNLSEQVQLVVARPWFALREEYARAARELLGLTGAMDDVANRAFKGQRPSRQAEAPQREPEPEQGLETAASDESQNGGPVHERSRQRNSTIQVQVQSPSLGALLDFQEQLSRLANVARVSMSQVNEERAVLIVELEPERVESNN